ncbi:hypothetical protein TSUD_28990 [Trifolium subterraneum]|uniref:Uncharacterized protein n=1 Tax=Trifolium subterraneum TaxID=3900 RepID=A0A2Z6NKM6_TRISU|nr:hypothetical protein TSUD_28990 [Trifolium subterraneum]
MLEGEKSIVVGAATIASTGAAIAAYAVRRQELSSLEKFPRPDRGLGGVRIEDSLNWKARLCRNA